jgi:hypothetical protein
MNPAKRDFDPKLYQYGGLWVYPVGALIKLSLNPKTKEHYLNHPEQFGQFYVIARLYVVLWGLVGVWAVFRIAGGCGAGTIGAVGAALLYIFMPVVVNMSHEAKPHLPGAVLVLLAAMSAGKFVESGRSRWWVMTGILCGMSAAMVLTGATALLIPPIMVLLRPMALGRRAMIAATAVAIGIVVYFAANPYVLLHLLGDSTILKSNLGNSKAMYEVARIGEGLVTAMKLMWESATPLVLGAGVIGAILMLRRGAQPPVDSARGQRPAALRVAIAISIVLAVQFVALAAGKPAEYGRFALVPSIVLAVCAGALIGRARIRTFEKVESFALMVVLMLLPSFIYLYGFVRDSSAWPRRMVWAEQLQLLERTGARTLGVERDPAPYRLPPVNLFEWKIMKLPDDFDLATSDALTDVIVRPVDALGRHAPASRAYVRINERGFEDVFPARISWANKPLEIWVRRELVAR